MKSAKLKKNLFTEAESIEVITKLGLIKTNKIKSDFISLYVLRMKIKFWYYIQKLINSKNGFLSADLCYSDSERNCPN